MHVISSRANIDFLTIYLVHDYSQLSPIIEFDNFVHILLHFSVIPLPAALPERLTTCLAKDSHCAGTRVWTSYEP